jgi:lysophospholipase L1-like esterase
MLGDSITSQGGNWNKLLNRTDVANLGIPGDTTDDVLERMEDVFLLKPKKCFVMIGINDISRKTSMEIILKNYRKIIKELKTHNIEPVVQSTLNVNAPSDLKKKNTKVNELNKWLKTIAKSEDIIFIDVNMELSSNGVLDARYAKDDGIHLSDQGYEKWRDVIVSYFQGSIE